ncbi:hypothetical protein [Serratia liquefaciens]|uniref:hypothetical protein n=1 Tax=Serratia liquefaciens TaxID=614 RepID=UPI0021C5AFCC|nr:hypothetical protein [Serratia liquefaciens]
MTKNTQSILDPISLATAQAAIESFADLKSHEDLLKFSSNCSLVLKLILSNSIVESFDQDELDALMLALISSKDIAAAKAVTLALQYGGK